MFVPERGKGRPVYEQLYRYFRNEIESGAIKAGERLPSRRQLSRSLKVSPGTVEVAYSQLVAEGYAAARGRSGYFVDEALFPALAPQEAGAARSAQTEHDAAHCRFTLRTNAVDTEHFPFSTWSRLMRECLREEERTLLLPLYSQGDLGLREEIVRYLHKYRGLEADPAQIIIGAGSEFLLSLVVQLLGRERLYAVEDPGYRKISEVLRVNGARTKAVPLDERGLRTDLLEESAASAVHMTPSHHFPLATVTPMSRRTALLAWASSGDRFIIEDDYDSEFRFSGRPIPALASLEGGRRVIYMNTFTKSLAPSLRIGYMVLPESLLQRYREQFSFFSCTVSCFEQRTLQRFLARGHFERHLNRMKNIYRTSRDIFIGELRRGLGDALSIEGENTGLHLLCTVKGCGEGELVSRAAAAGVRVYGLSTFYSDPTDVLKTSTAVLGYSGYGSADLVEIARLLTEAWK